MKKPNYHNSNSHLAKELLDKDGNKVNMRDILFSQGKDLELYCAQCGGKVSATPKNGKWLIRHYPGTFMKNYRECTPLVLNAREMLKEGEEFVIPVQTYAEAFGHQSRIENDGSPRKFSEYCPVIIDGKFPFDLAFLYKKDRNFLDRPAIAKQTRTVIKKVEPDYNIPGTDIIVDAYLTLEAGREKQLVNVAISFRNILQFDREDAIKLARKDVSLMEIYLRDQTFNNTKKLKERVLGVFGVEDPCREFLYSSFAKRAFNDNYQLRLSSNYNRYVYNTVTKQEQTKIMNSNIASLVKSVKKWARPAKYGSLQLFSDEIKNYPVIYSAPIVFSKDDKSFEAPVLVNIERKKKVNNISRVDWLTITDSISCLSTYSEKALDKRERDYYEYANHDKSVGLRAEQLYDLIDKIRSLEKPQQD